MPFARVLGVGSEFTGYDRSGEPLPARPDRADVSLIVMVGDVAAAVDFTVRPGGAYPRGDWGLDDVEPEHREAVTQTVRAAAPRIWREVLSMREARSSRIGRLLHRIRFAVGF